MKLTRIRPVGRFINPLTGRPVNVKTGKRVGRSVDIKFYLLQGTRMLISDREFSETWIKESA